MSKRKRRIFEELITEVRASQAATDRYDQAVADSLGINRTDMRCLDLLDREGPITAGRIAESTGLTTGAVTTVIDRLEQSGFARRVRDDGDRRRVLVELVPEMRTRAADAYTEHQRLGERLYELYTEEQLVLLRDFVRRSRVFNEEQAARLERETREKRKG